MDDPAAEVDAAVWQQIVSGVRAQDEIYWRTITHLRRLKRRELRRRERVPYTLSGELFDNLAHNDDDVAGVVERVAVRQLLASLDPQPSHAAQRWIAHVAQGRGTAGGGMPAVTRVAGSRWARRVRDQAEDALACAS